MNNFSSTTSTASEHIASTASFQDRFLAWLYGSHLGRALLPILVRPAISKLGGIVLNSKLSTLGIAGFIRSNNIDMSQFEQREFSSYNDFFTRKILPSKRPICPDERALISPCDSVLSAYRVAENTQFHIKGTEYTLEQLLRSKELATLFDRGTVLVFRLTVADYHRYCYPVSGNKTQDKLLPGIFNTVNPIAAACRPIYKENTRVLSVVTSDVFGQVLVMEVGALMVGKIVHEHPEACAVTRGTEKGRFEFGGSTIIVCLQENAAEIDAVYFQNTEQNIETPVQYGQKIGIAAH